MPIGTQQARGARIHWVKLQNPGQQVPDGEGGTTFSAPVDLGGMFANVAPATARDLERVVAGTVQSQASHLVTIDYLAGVSTATKVLFGGRVLNVTGVVNIEERNSELVLACTEVVQ